MITTILNDYINDCQSVTSKPKFYQQKILLCIWWTTAYILWASQLWLSDHSWHLFGATLTGSRRTLKKITLLVDACVLKEHDAFQSDNLQDNAHSHTTKVTRDKLNLVGKFC